MQQPGQTGQKAPGPTAEALGSSTRDPAALRPHDDAAGPRAGRRPSAGIPFARRHALFVIVVLAAAVPRVIAMLGYPGTMLTPDSLHYARLALRLRPYPVRPVGYSALLWLLKPFHSLVFVAGIQHAMGLGIGVIVYALLRRRFGMPGWAATLAAVPALFSVYAIQIEHFLLSDTLFALFVTAAVALMLRWPVPPVWAYALTGLLLGAASLDRVEGVPLFAVFLGCVTVRFTRSAARRTVAGALAMCTMFALPLIGYASWFQRANGVFGLTTATGTFLYSRIIPFADCAKIKPPPAERKLCLDVPVSERHYPDYYVWHLNTPMWTVPGGAFSNRADLLGADFAFRAIKAQPLDYLAAVGHTAWESFWPPRGPDPQAQSQKFYVFPVAAPRGVAIPAAYESDLRAYNGDADPNLRLVQPFAGWIRIYQRFVVVPGPLLGVITLCGLIGIALAWRGRGGPALLPWLTGVALLVVPAATSDFDARYVVCTIPLLAIAAAIAGQDAVHLHRRRADRQAAGLAPAASAQR
jgi:hypothetical protein